ncbi:hypothetical protein L6164_025858 [Bauhinia variegata]|uniref:Uncharacterized protein n=1 Tax=Bauhinia variegata TaxID=167791 RepID=A0ACB9M3P7_BAUVA|nr:hypothetical protein L6164_025858 [Bauhinia variegata]
MLSSLNLVSIPSKKLAEEATNKVPCSSDAKTMTRIAEASFGIDDYLRIADILHRRQLIYACNINSNCRFFNIDWDEWRQSYKSLVLLEFLLTHCPEEFQCDTEVILELGNFT